MYMYVFAYKDTHTHRVNILPKNTSLLGTTKHLFSALVFYEYKLFKRQKTVSYLFVYSEFTGEMDKLFLGRASQ